MPTDMDTHSQNISERCRVHSRFFAGALEQQQMRGNFAGKVLSVACVLIFGGEGIAGSQEGLMTMSWLGCTLR